MQAIERPGKAQERAARWIAQGYQGRLLCNPWAPNGIQACFAEQHCEGETAPPSHSQNCPDQPGAHVYPKRLPMRPGVAQSDTQTVHRRGKPMGYTWTGQTGEGTRPPRQPAMGPLSHGSPILACNGTRFRVFPVNPTLLLGWRRSVDGPKHPRAPHKHPQVPPSSLCGDTAPFWAPFWPVPFAARG